MLARTQIWPAVTGIATYSIIAILDAGGKGRGAHYVYRNAQQLRCSYCGTARFRLHSAGRREPCFACDGCGQRLETI